LLQLFSEALFFEEKVMVDVELMIIGPWSFSRFFNLLAKNLFINPDVELDQ
jgi:hypothetical protein